jgi:hypothetical protein
MDSVVASGAVDPGFPSPSVAHYLDFESTSLCSLSLLLHAQRRSNKYQSDGLWFDPMAMETQDLQHQRRAQWCNG